MKSLRIKNRHLRSIRSLCTLIITLVFSVSAAHAQKDAAEIIHVVGNPQIMRAEKGVWEACTAGSFVREGDKIHTKREEAVELSFERTHKNVVRIGEGSEVIIGEVSPARNSIELENGGILSLMRKLPPKSTFEIKTPAGISGARGTGWGTKTDGSRMTASSFERSIYVQGIQASGSPLEGKMILKAGQKTTFGKFKKPSTLERITRKERHNWLMWKRDLYKRIGKMARRRRRLDKASGLNKKIESLMEKKDLFNETRDLDRIERRQNKGSSDSGGQGGYER